MINSRFVVAVVLVASFCPLASGETDQLLQDLAREEANSVVLVNCTFEENSATSAAKGPAICIDESGEFMSLAFSTSMRSAKVKKCVITLPGVGNKPLRAELMRIDRATGVGFVRCTDPAAPKWKPITFVEKTDLTVGTRVVSVGIMPGDPANTLYYGSASVSSVLRVPQRLVYVGGGWLTLVGSPVFISPTQAVGVVGRQLGQAFDMVAFRRRDQAILTPMRDTAFFTPSDEIINVIANRKKESTMSWAGVENFKPVDMEALGLSKPAVRVGKIIPDHPASKAGLKELDVIVQMDGKDLEQLATPELTTANFYDLLTKLPIGRKVTFTLENGSKKSLVLTSMPTHPLEAPRYAEAKLGLMVREKVMLDEYLIKSPSAKTPGLIVINVPKGGPSQQGGLEKGDVITSINAQPVRKVETMRTILDKAIADTAAPTINMEIQRGAESKLVSIKIPR